MYHNHISVSAFGRFNRRSYNKYSAMRQTGIFPRGGGGGVVTATRTRRRVSRRDPSLKISMLSPSRPFIPSDHSKLPDDGSLFEQHQEEDIEEDTDVQVSQKQNNVWRNILPPAVTNALDEIFAPGALLVTGKVIATAVIYLSISRASLFQIGNISDLRALIVDPSNLRQFLTVPGMFLRNRIGNRNDRAQQNSVAATVPSTIFRDEVDENEKLRTEELSDSLSDSTAIEIEEVLDGDSESEYDSLPSDNVAPITDENKVVEVDDAFSSFVQPAHDLDNAHLNRFLFRDQIIS